MTDAGAARLFAPARLGPIEVRNRIVKCATYETRGRAGLVTDDLVDWHRTFARGGVGMTTLAYCAVSGDGRTFPDQIWLRDEARGVTVFAGLAKEILERIVGHSFFFLLLIEL